MNVLAIDIGGTNVKVLASGAQESRRFPSGRTLTPEKLVQGIHAIAGDWEFQAIAIGYPGVIVQQRIVTDPHNLAPGWIDVDFAAAFGKPVRLINDAAMQALGSYQGGEMLFLGLGTGLGTALVVSGVVVPMEIGHLDYRKGTFEDYLGARGLKRLGPGKWEKHVHRVVQRMIASFHPSDVVLGGGNVKKLKDLPDGCRKGDNANAFLGGFRLWNPDAVAMNAGASIKE